MSSVSHALRTFRQHYTAMLAAADVLRVTLEAAAGEVHADPRIAQIQAIVAEHFGCTVERMLRRDRHAEVALARQTAMTLAREFTSFTLERIASDFGGFDHNTVIHAVRAVDSRASTDGEFADSLFLVRAKVKATLALLPKYAAAHG